MSVVDKVFSVWSNLEQSYLDRGGKLSRKEFLFKSINYNGNGTQGIDTLKSYVMAEYEGNEEKCDALVRIFDAIAENVKNIPDEILHLDAFVGDLIASFENKSSAISVAVPEDFLEGLNPYRSRKTSYNGVSKNMIEFDVLGDVFYIKGGEATASLVEGVISDHLVLLKGRKTIERFLKQFSAGDYFTDLVYATLGKLSEEGKNLKNLTFLSSKFAKLKGDYLVCDFSGVESVLPVDRVLESKNTKIVFANYKSSLCDKIVVGII
jgi:hypothetical protein